MSVFKGKLTILSIILSSILSTNIYADEILTNDIETEQVVNQRTIPETLQTLIDTPGKKSVITIPMSKDEYKKKIQDTIESDWSDDGRNLGKAFNNVTYNDNVAIANFNTESKKINIMIHDKSTDFNFEYSFAAGYVLSTTLKKFINAKDDDADEKLDYLTTTFENYLIEKGFKKNDSILNNIYGILNRSKEYISGNHIVTISKESNFMTSIFKVTMKNKEIEDNIDEINKIIQEESIKYEYQSLSKILK